MGTGQTGVTMANLRVIERTDAAADPSADRLR
jgi:hypothetical protein